MDQIAMGTNPSANVGFLNGPRMPGIPPAGMTYFNLALDRDTYLGYGPRYVHPPDCATPLHRSPLHTNPLNVDSAVFAATGEQLGSAAETEKTKKKRKQSPKTGADKVTKRRKKSTRDAEGKKGGGDKKASKTRQKRECRGPPFRREANSDLIEERLELLYSVASQRWREHIDEVQVPGGNIGRRGWTMRRRKGKVKQEAAEKVNYRKDEGNKSGGESSEGDE